MDRCPTCGEEIRIGAKFCTTCGTRLDTENGFATVPPLEVNAVAQEQNQPETANASWPTPPTRNESDTFAAWGAPRAAEPNASEETVNTWQRGGNAWPAPPSAVAPGLSVSDEPTSAPAEAGSDSVFVDEEPAQRDDPAAASPAQERALALLDELRTAVAGLGAGSAIDTSSVISDLEVAITPPGAIPPDDLSDLRDALFAARERPKDLDTILDLTGRIDSLLALVIAYDRATAAIERSLRALRQG